MMKRITAVLLATLLALGCVGCGWLDEEDEPAGGGGAGASGSAETPKTQQGEANGSQGEPEQGLTLSVNRDTGALSVKRMALADSAHKGDQGKWTIFVYLCGTDLESEDASATDDLIEMCDGATGDGVRFVVETGGAEEWLNDTVDASKLQRYLIENEDIELVDEQKRSGMGREKTLADFLSWGVENYASEHMGVILWNHGGGCITGVCFDETDGDDGLTMRELDGALFSVCSDMDRKFDFIGFDACLMSTLETANILATYANYMVASEETEPGTGWDYVSIGRYLGANPGADAKQLGVVICDSFLESCKEIDDDDLCTLSVVDLSKIDALLVAFNDFAHGMYDSAADTASCADMVRSIGKADNFGGNNRAEGYTNMVDMGGIISACSSYADGAQATLNALKSCIAYSISGSSHKTASGLSMYYPLSVQGSDELSVFSDICPSPYYISFVDRQSQSSVNAGAADDYDDDFWFDDDGNWFWGLLGSWWDDEDYDWDDEDYDWDEYYEDYYDYWGYLDDYEQTGESPLITFSVEPHLDSSGSFWFELDDEGYSYAADVYGVVYELSADGEDLIELGQTYDLNGGWDTGRFADDFDGWWISLPDGQNLAVYIVEDTESYTIYTSPIELNGEETNLRLKLDYDKGTMTIEGAWDGIDECGASSRDIIKLKSGDVITPLYYAYSLETDDEFYYYGWEYTIRGTPEICYDIMEDGDYLYAFCIDDIYGDYYMTDFVYFTVEDGEVYFTED
ncbi:MAG: hypothetical protein E7425_14355 [Ruminococcaceae bacterium]|nr:hypothetical protein [Oscillospiraceae bacterium]